MDHPWVRATLRAKAIAAFPARLAALHEQQKSPQLPVFGAMQNHSPLLPAQLLHWSPPQCWSVTLRRGVTGGAAGGSSLSFTHTFEFEFNQSPKIGIRVLQFHHNPAQQKADDDQSHQYQVQV
jgi:hypothetical protein